MTKLVSALALTATLVLPTLAQADDANKNGSTANPQSSAAVTPQDNKHSAGTVGAMKGAEGGSFTASDKDQKKDTLEAK